MSQSRRQSSFTGEGVCCRLSCSFSSFASEGIDRNNDTLPLQCRRNKAQARVKTEARASQSTTAVLNAQNSAKVPESATAAVNPDNHNHNVGISAQPVQHPEQAVPAIEKDHQNTPLTTSSHPGVEIDLKVPTQMPTARAESVHISMTSSADTAASRDLLNIAQTEGAIASQHQASQTGQNSDHATNSQIPKVAASGELVPILEASSSNATAQQAKTEENLSKQDTVINTSIQEGVIDNATGQRGSTPLQPRHASPKEDVQLSDRTQIDPAPYTVVGQEELPIQANKRKRSTTPAERALVDEPASNRPRSTKGTYDRYANQRLPPSTARTASEEIRNIIPSDNSKTEHKSSPQPGRKSVSQEGLLPLACTQELVCVFVGHIPHNAKEADVRPWLFTSRSLPRPVIVTKLASARGTPNGHQYLRIFFKNHSEADNAVGILRKSPFEQHPAQLLIRALKQEPRKVKLYWRDVESWARPYLEDLASSSLSSSSSSLSRREVRPASEQTNSEQNKQAEIRRQVSTDRPTSRHQSPQSVYSTYDADRLANRLDGSSTRYDRYEADQRRPPPQRTPSGSYLDRSLARSLDNERDDDLARRVRVSDAHSRSVHGVSPGTNEGRRASKDDLFRRFDASPPRRRRDYSPQREPKRDYRQEDRSDLLGRLR